MFAQPDNQAARDLQADAYEQMGYQIEGPQWRGIFLTAARELREGVLPAVFATGSPDTILAMPIDILFDFVAVHVDGEKAAEADLRIDFTFTDLDETWTMWIKRGVLNARRGASPDTQLTVSGPKAALVGVVLKPAAAGHSRRPADQARRRRIGAGDFRRASGRIRPELQHRHALAAERHRRTMRRWSAGGS